MGQLIVSRASVHGFLVLDWWHRRDEALRRLAEWQLAGKIRFKEDVLEGIERNAGSVSAAVARQELRQADRKDQLKLVPPAQWLLARGAYFPATFAKPSTNFTNSLPSFFAFVSGLWLKTDAGPRDGENKKW